MPLPGPDEVSQALVEHRDPFLTALLCGTDLDPDLPPPDIFNIPFTISVVAEGRKDDRALTRIYHGTLRQMTKAMAISNKRQAAVYVFANEMDGTGDGHKEHFKDSRALVADLDDRKPQEVDLSVFPLPPHIIVETKRGTHLWWLVESGIAPGILQNLGIAIAQVFGSDNVATPNHVFRLPGYWHWKDPSDPALMRVHATHRAPRYTLAQFVAAIPEGIKPSHWDEEVQVVSARGSKIEWEDEQERLDILDKLRIILATRAPAYFKGSEVDAGFKRNSAPNHQGDNWTFRTMMLVGDYVPDEKDALEVASAWAAKCSPPVSRELLARKWRAACAARTEFLGTKTVDERINRALDQHAKEVGMGEVIVEEDDEGGAGIPPSPSSGEGNQPPPTPTPSGEGNKPPPPGRTIVRLVTEQRVVALTVTSCIAAGVPNVFQRTESLVTIAGNNFESESLHIKVMTNPNIAMVISDVVDVRDKVKKVWQSVQPPSWLVSGIHDMGYWPDIPYLSGVSSSPVLRADGSVVDQTGYDAVSKIYFHPDTKYPAILPHPTFEDAKAAAARLVDLVIDVPFENAAHRAAYLAAILSIVGRFAYKGSCPLFLFDANIRGAGKSLVMMLAATIGVGPNNTAFCGYTDDEAEFEKATVAHAMRGSRVILMDNITGKFGNPVLDRALTHDRFQGRKLGKNELADVEFQANWMASGNNVQVKDDTARRVLHIHLKSDEEMPERRTGFKHPNLREHVQKNRASLYVDAVTILKAFIEAGSPQFSLPAWGSFEAWGALVRNALVWTGYPDPLDANKGMEEDHKVASPVGSLVMGLEEFLASRNETSASTAQIIEALEQDDRDARSTGAAKSYSQLREALAELCYHAKGGGSGLPAAKSLGYTLRAYKDRVVRGRRIIRDTEVKTGTSWKVEVVKQG